MQYVWINFVNHVINYAIKKDAHGICREIDLRVELTRELMKPAHGRIEPLINMN